MTAEHLRHADVRPIQPIQLTWAQGLRGILIVIAPNVLVVLADFFGWLVVNSYQLYPVLLLAGMLVLVGVHAFERRSGWTSTYFTIAFLVVLPAISANSRDVQQEARWRIALISACTSAAPGSDIAGQCRDARVRADYEPCDFGTNADACRRELYRDAGWPLDEQPIAPHHYGDTLPLEVTPP